MAAWGVAMAWVTHVPLREATAELDVQVVISCGSLASQPWAQKLPEHVRAVPYAPQLRLLERADVFITHGGANSMMEAIVAGVPVIISPVCNDQPMQAFFLERAGTGRVVDVSRASVEELRGAIGALVSKEAPERAAMRRMQESYLAADGARRAAELAESLVGRTSP